MSWTENLFKLQDHGTTVRTEVIAGVTTFLTMAYIIFVNPAILGDAGMPKSSVFVATCLIAALGTAVMALYANYPIALAPGMFPLLKQVQIAADFSRGIAARLAGVDVPVFAGDEKSFADLDALLAQTLAFLDSVNAAQFEGKEGVEIVLRPGTPKEKKLSGQAYLANYGLPQFFFHVTTAYAILRHNGLPIGKRDYMGAY